MRLTLPIAILSCWLALFTGQAAAQNQGPPEIKSQFDLNTFRAASTPEDGFALDHAAVLKSWQLGTGILLQYDDDPLTWQQKNDDGEYRERKTAVERFAVLHLGAALGFFDYAQLAIHFPAFVDIGAGNSRGGPGDLRIIPKGAYRFQSGEADIGLALIMPLSVPTGDEERLMGEGVVKIAPGIAADFVVGKLRIVLNAAYSWREAEELDVLRGAELLLGLGAEYDLVREPGTLRALLELNVATQTGDFFGRASAPSDFLLGLKHRFKAGIGLFGGAGGGMSPGVGAPDFRLVLGVDYVLQQPDKKAIAEKAKASQDSDGDGWSDGEDKCPDEPEDFDHFADQDGCPEPDNDLDGILDRTDKCPDKPENLNGMDDEDGCPESDTDGDGIADDKDLCPKEKEDVDGFEDDDGCKEEDNDLDGINDKEDTCPMLPESFNDRKDDDGCPDFFRVVDNKFVFSRKIRFEHKTAKLHDTAFEILDEVISVVISNASWEEMTITVHASGRGKDSENQTLTEERAFTIMRILVGGGVIPERLIAIGKGNSEPLAPPSSREGRKQNARVEIIINKGAAQ